MQTHHSKKEKYLKYFESIGLIAVCLLMLQTVYDVVQYHIQRNTLRATGYVSGPWSISQAGLSPSTFKLSRGPAVFALNHKEETSFFRNVRQVFFVRYSSDQYAICNVSVLKDQKQKCSFVTFSAMPERVQKNLLEHPISALEPGSNLFETWKVVEQMVLFAKS